MPCRYKINIALVEKSLRAVQEQFERINETLDMRREPMQDEIVGNMLAGYAYVNMLLERDINPLHPKQLHHILELNNIVLCGTDEKARIDYQGYIEATKHRFYRQEEFSIANIRAWAEKHKKDAAYNHRSGALLMSSILAHSGNAPFVLTVDNAKAYFDPSSLAKETHKNLFGKYYKLPKIKKKFSRFLEREANANLLITC